MPGRKGERGGTGAMGEVGGPGLPGAQGPRGTMVRFNCFLLTTQFRCDSSNLFSMVIDLFVAFSMIFQLDFYLPYIGQNFGGQNAKNLACCRKFCPPKIFVRQKFCPSDKVSFYCVQLQLFLHKFFKIFFTDKMSYTCPRGLLTPLTCHKT